MAFTLLRTNLVDVRLGFVVLKVSHCLFIYFFLSSVKLETNRQIVSEMLLDVKFREKNVLPILK